MRLRLICLLALCIVGSSGRAIAQDPSVLVSDLLKEIQRGVNDANTKITQDFNNVPPLDSVTLQLQTQTDFSGSGGINLWFIKIGGGSDKTSSTQMTVVLKPATVAKAVSNETLDQTISNALYAAAKGIHDSQVGAGALPLLVDSLTAEFAFTVKNNASGGIQFNLLPVGGNATVGGAKSNVQKITVKFGNPSPKKDSD
jgi:hypothetical protein